MDKLDLTKTIKFEVLGDIKPTIIEVLGYYATHISRDFDVTLHGTQISLPSNGKYLTYYGWLSRDREADKEIITRLYKKGIIKVYSIKD